MASVCSEYDRIGKNLVALATDLVAMYSPDWRAQKSDKQHLSPPLSNGNYAVKALGQHEL